MLPRKSKTTGPVSVTRAADIRMDVTGPSAVMVAPSVFVFLITFNYIPRVSTSPANKFELTDAAAVTESNWLFRAQTAEKMNSNTARLANSIVNETPDS